MSVLAFLVAATSANPWLALGPILGTLFGIAIKALGDAYAEGRRTSVEDRKIDAQVGHEEREITERFAIEDRAERRQAHAENRELLEQLRKLSVQLAESEAARAKQAADHAAERSAERAEMELLRDEVRSLRTQIDLQSQLLDRQREQINDLVRRLMTGTEPA